MTGPAKPYPGLRPFERDEDAIFFGREEQTDQLLKKLGENHFVAVLGASGSGKSSLVRAGVLPALEGGFLAEAGAHWEIATLRPGDCPMRRLAESLVQDTAWGRDHLGAAPSPRPSAAAATATAGRREGSPPTAEALAADLAKGPMALNWLLGVRPLPGGIRLLILVDQFEELFRYRRDAGAGAGAFVALLLAAAGHPSVYVVITMRSDFLGDCARHPGLPEAVNAGLFLTPRLDPEQMADAIRLPARVFGGEVQPALVRRLLDEAGGEMDQLPLLQHALMRLWDQDDKRLTLGEFERLGGLRQALDDHAEEGYGELDQARRQIADALFRNLVERGAEGRDTRRPAKLEDVAALAEVPTDAVAEVADVFRRQGWNFLMPPPGEPLLSSTMIDITHEALIRQWQRLSAWAVAEGDRAEIYLRLEADARRRREKGMGSLWSGYELAVAVPWLENREHAGRWALRYAADGMASVDMALAFLQESAKAEETARQAEEERRRQAEQLAEAARRAREETEGLIEFMLFDLRDKLRPFGRLDLLQDVNERVKAYYEHLGADSDDLAMQRRRSVALNNCGDTLLAQGDLAGALGAYEESKGIRERLAASDTSNAEWQRDVVVSLWKLTGEGLAEPEAARGYLQRALEILQRLDAEGKLHGAHRDWPDLIRGRLESLGH